ncbi:uncharacterized protein AKAME5_001201800 [Lates japonicus]|uniref:Uncharacterized protein n=1 Tax=Lates japonicus TaxID=270547 RepID=A0AAD3R8X7_LATJO|nr:uncharacterized protein AKAME5_001201800 [Lates japonicus]
MQVVRTLVAERLAAAAEEIFTVVERKMLHTSGTQAPPGLVSDRPDQMRRTSRDHGKYIRWMYTSWSGWMDHPPGPGLPWLAVGPKCLTTSHPRVSPPVKESDLFNAFSFILSFTEEIKTGGVRRQVPPAGHGSPDLSRCAHLMHQTMTYTSI